MIPKTIHYCWFGRNPKPALAQKCMASWKKHCPDYELIEWNEDNFPPEYNEYTQWCYENQKWAFLSDFVRLVVVRKQGGIYFDTDVEVLRPFDPFLEHEAFYCFENDRYVATGLGFGSIADHPTVAAMESEYLKLKKQADGSFCLRTCPQLNTEALTPFGLQLDGTLQLVAGARILPKEYMNPYDDPTGTLIRTEHTWSIHWYSKSWMSKKTILRSKLTQPFHRIFGTDCFGWLKR